MLTYAFRDFRLNTDDDIAGEKFEEIHELFAEILIRGVSHLLKKGLFKTYESNEGPLTTIRGKIHLYKTCELEQTNPNHAYCSYDELTENNIFNQILKTTFEYVQKCNNISSSRKKSIRSLLMYFHGIDSICLQNVRWNALCFDSRNKNYQMLIYVCKFIKEDMIMTTENGEYRMKALSDDNMCLLYQRFVLAYYQRHYPNTNARSEQIKWKFKEEDDISNGLLPIMQTDIMLSLGERTLIIDTKYYSQVLQSHYNKEVFHSRNFMQLYAYMDNYDVEHTGKVDGMLLYAKTEEDISPDFDRELIDGNRIYVRTLDLNQDFQGICVQLGNCIKKKS